MRNPILPISLFALVSLQVAAAGAYENRHIFVTNRGGNNIVELDDDLNLVTTWFGSEGLSVPNGMAFTPSGQLFVADTGNNRILGFDAAGLLTVSWDATPYSAPAVESLNFDKNGLLYVSANPGDGRVPRFQSDGTFVSNLVDAPAFSNLGNVNLTLQGHVILADFSAAGRGMREIDPATGTVINTFGEEAGLLQEDVAVDGADRIFVSQFNKNEIAVYDASRAYERSITETGLSRPTGIVITHDCRVVVASFDTAELFEFKHDGTFLRKVAVAGLSLPESLAIAGQRLPGSFESPSLEAVPKCDGTDPDGGTPQDASADAEPPADAAVDGSVMDAPVMDANDASADAPAPGDAAKDANAQADAGVPGDASGGSGGGASAAEPESDSGCGCRVAAPRSLASGAWMAFLGVVGAALLRRRGRSGIPRT